MQQQKNLVVNGETTQIARNGSVAPTQIKQQQLILIYLLR